MDEKSVKELGRWPWPRTMVADLVDILKSYGAKAVGFDIVFAEPDRYSSLADIRELAREVEKAGIGNPKLTRILREKAARADTDAALAQS